MRGNNLEYFRLEQTVESFEINYSSAIRIDTNCTTENGKYYSEVSCDGLELLETKIKCEQLLSDDDEQIKGSDECISTSYESFNEAEATKPINNVESGRLSVDQRSTCSPSTTNLNVPLLSPEEVKKEPLDESDLKLASTPAETSMPPIFIEEKLTIVEQNFHFPISHVENMSQKRNFSSEPIDATSKRSRLDLSLRSPDNGVMTSNGMNQFLIPI